MGVPSFDSYAPEWLLQDKYDVIYIYSQGEISQNCSLHSGAVHTYTYSTSPMLYAMTVSADRNIRRSALDLSWQSLSGLLAPSLAIRNRTRLLTDAPEGLQPCRHIANMAQDTMNDLYMYNDC